MTAFYCQSVNDNVNENVIFGYCYLGYVASISMLNNGTLTSSKMEFNQSVFFFFERNTSDFTLVELAFTFSNNSGLTERQNFL